VWDDPATQAVIEGNTLTGNTAGVAIAVINGGGVDPVVTVAADNIFSGNDVAIDVQSVGAFGSPTLSVSGSAFNGNDTGLAVVSGMTADNIEAHLNTFAGNTTGIANSGTGSLDAENNWWNSVTGPTHASNAAGTGDAAGDMVDFKPWCSDATCTAFVPPFATSTTISADASDPSAIEENVTVTAAVAAVLSGAPTPAGTVTVSGGAADCTITLVSGAGSCAITFTTGGAKTITATYNPASTDFSVSSDTESHTVEEGSGVDVGVGSNADNLDLLANETMVSNYPGVMDGPVHVQDTEPGFILASQRVTSGNSYNEVMGIPTSQLTNEYWFPFYDHGYPAVPGSGMRTWILIGNPDDTLTANVDIYIGGVLMDSYDILPGSRVTPRWIGLQDGPVHVLSDIPVFASERVFTAPGNSFNETFGYPASQFTTEYWFPWYDSVSMNASILVGNTSATETAEVDIYIGAALMDSYEIAANDTLIQSYPATMDGPVRVVVTNAIDIVASEAALSGPVGNRRNYNEVIGYPFDQFDTEYWFPWYDHGYPGVSGSNMRTWILVGNPDDTQTADVDIYIDGTFMGNFPVPPNSRVTPRWISLQGGPVQVVSDIPIFVSERVLTSPSNAFNEMMGFPASQLANEYWFPWYDSVNMSNDILITRP
jgi:hypothetical protein